MGFSWVGRLSALLWGCAVSHIFAATQSVCVWENMEVRSGICIGGVSCDCCGDDCCLGGVVCCVTVNGACVWNENGAYSCCVLGGNVVRGGSRGHCGGPVVVLVVGGPVGGCLIGGAFEGTGGRVLC